MGIELFRGIAALMVLLTHYARFITSGDSPMAFLWTGVDLFFVISGFVFAPMVLAAPGGRVALLPYLLRRFFRLYPLYLLALLAYALVTPEDPDKTQYFLRHLVFLQTTVSYEEAFFFNPAFWSLPVEVEFYLALPLLALLGGGRRLALLFAASVVLSMTLNWLRGPEDLLRILSVHLTGILPEFLVGVYLWRLVQRPAPPPALAWAAPLAGAGLLALAFQAQHGDSGLRGFVWVDAPFNLLCALGYAGLMYPVLRVRDADWRPAWAALALACGSVSYGVYLFHNLIPRLLPALGLEPAGWDFLLLCTFLTLALAAVLYRLIENPARRFGRSLSRRLLHGRAERQASPAPRLPI